MRRRRRATGGPLTAGGPGRRSFGARQRPVRRRWGRHRPARGPHRRAPRPPGPGRTGRRSLRTPGNLRLGTRIAGTARRAGRLRGRSGCRRDGIGRPVRGRCRPRRRTPLPRRRPLLAGRDLRRIGPEPACRRGGCRPLGPGSMPGGRRRSVRAWTSIGRFPAGWVRRPILRRRLVNSRRAGALTGPRVGSGLGPVTPRPLVGGCRTTSLATALLLGWGCGPVLGRPRSRCGRRPVLRRPRIGGP